MNLKFAPIALPERRQKKEETQQPVIFIKIEYFVLFIDKATKYMFVEFLHTLTQTQDAYNKLRTTVSTHFKGKKIRFFRADGHGTYTSDEMMATYEEDSTIPKFRASHNPNGNALSEREIRTIISMARTLLHSSGLPLNMWEAAVRHAVWIHNRVTTRDEDVKSPHQFFFFCFGALVFCWLCVLLHCCVLCWCVGEIVEDLVNISSLGKKIRTVLESLESNSKRMVYFFVFSYLKFLS